MGRGSGRGGKPSAGAPAGRCNPSPSHPDFRRDGPRPLPPGEGSKRETPIPLVECA
jgi:hypothetical protein